MNIITIMLLILVPLIGAFGVAFFVAGYLGFFTGGDKPRNIFQARMRPWILFHDKSSPFIVFALIGAILLFMIFLLLCWVYSGETSFGWQQNLENRKIDVPVQVWSATTWA